MSETRLTKQIFMYDYSICKNNWCSEIKILAETVDQMEQFTDCNPFDISTAWAILFEKKCTVWKRNVTLSPKLQYYSQFKCNFGVEPYVLHVRNREMRSVFC